MKTIIASDTHEKAEEIEKIVQFAKANGIDTVLDAGDLHGYIESYRGVNVHAVYWGEASGAMERRAFSRDIQSIDGTMHENGSTFKLDDLAIFIQHNLAEYKTQIPQKSLDVANERLDWLEQDNPDEPLQRFVLFGHTHNQHYNNDGKSIAINPGSAGHNGLFAVLDTDNGSVVYYENGEEILKVDFDSDLTQVRHLSKEQYTARLRNGNEVFVYDKDGEKARTEEFSRIISANTKGDDLNLHVQDEENLEQLIRGNFRSKKFKKIGNVFEEAKEGKLTGNIQSYIATKEIDGADKQILVIGKDEIESEVFDKISTETYASPMIDETRTIFVGQTKVSENEEPGSFSEDKDYIDHIVLNDKTIATYKSVKEIRLKEGITLFTANEEDGKSLVGIIDDQGQVQEGKRYDSVSDAHINGKIVDGKIIYTAKNEEEGNMFLVIDGVEQTKHDCDPKSYSDRISNTQFIDGKLAYVIQRNGYDTIIVDGQESGRVEKGEYSYSDGIKDLKEVDGKVGYLSKATNENAKVIIDGQVVLEDNQIQGFTSMDGKIVYQKDYDSGCFFKDGTKVEGYSAIHQIDEAKKEGKIN